MKKAILQGYENQVKHIYSLKIKAPVRGAYITALNKATKREFIVEVIKNDMNDLDVTTTAATQIIKRIMGRGVSNKYLLERFGTQDRTASNKSEIFTMDLKNYEDKIRKEYLKFQSELKIVLEAIQIKVKE